MEFLAKAAGLLGVGYNLLAGRQGYVDLEAGNYGGNDGIGGFDADQARQMVGAAVGGAVSAAASTAASIGANKFWNSIGYREREPVNAPLAIYRPEPKWMVMAKSPKKRKRPFKDMGREVPVLIANTEDDGPPAPSAPPAFPGPPAGGEEVMGRYRRRSSIHRAFERYMREGRDTTNWKIPAGIAGAAAAAAALFGKKKKVGRPSWIKRTRMGSYKPGVTYTGVTKSSYKKTKGKPVKKWWNGDEEEEYKKRRTMRSSKAPKTPSAPGVDRGALARQQQQAAVNSMNVVMGNAAQAAAQAAATEGGVRRERWFRENNGVDRFLGNVIGNVMKPFEPKLKFEL